jgi:hypothetical protein
MTREELRDYVDEQRTLNNIPYHVYSALIDGIDTLEQESRWIPVSEKYEHHIDHTDCIWYGNDSGCPVTCSQYRDGWNDAMDYIFKNGDGYHPYRRNENG